MPRYTIPAEGIALVDQPGQPHDAGATADKGRTAALLRVNARVMRELQQCASGSGSLRLIGGSAPRLEYGDKTIDLVTAPVKHTTQLYCRQPSSNALTYAATVTQRLALPLPKALKYEPVVTDNALASLKQSLASIKQEKESKQATISTSIIPNNKANRVLSSRYATSSSAAPTTSSTSHPGPTSAPSIDPVAAAKHKAMLKTLSHLLASSPLAEDAVLKLTQISRPRLRELLPKVAELQPDKTWELKGRVFKELDIYNFPYPSVHAKDAAVKNSVKAFDRLRLGKDDKHWQLLLPEGDRGKGKCLSRLHGATFAAAQAHQHSVRASSPLPQANLTGSPLPTSQTLSIASTSMARTASGTGKPVSIEKRLKESAKHRAAEAAKEVKRQEKEAHAKPAATKTSSTIHSASNKRSSAQFKSAERIHSSDDESDVQESAKTSQISGVKSRLQAAGSPGGTSSSDGKPLTKTSAAARNATNAAVPKPAASSSALSAKRESLPVTSATRSKDAVVASSRSAPSKTSSQALTPSQRTEKHAASGDSRAHLTPSKTVDRVKNSSPMVKGSTTPSLFGKHERAPIIVRKTTGVSPARSNVALTSAINDTIAPSRKRPAAETASDTERPRKAVKTEPTPAAKKPVPAVRAGQSGNSDTPLKRKANDISGGSFVKEIDATSQHRRTDSSSSRSIANSSSSNNSQTTTARTSVASPSPTFDTTSPPLSSTNNDSSYHTAEGFSWQRALDDAEQYQKLYPKYVEMHRKLRAMKPGEVTREESEKLWELHTKMDQIKKNIRLGATA